MKMLTARQAIDFVSAYGKGLNEVNSELRDGGKVKTASFSGCIIPGLVLQMQVGEDDEVKAFTVGCPIHVNVNEGETILEYANKVNSMLRYIRAQVPDEDENVMVLRYDFGQPVRSPEIEDLANVVAYLEDAIISLMDQPSRERLDQIQAYVSGVAATSAVH